MHIILSLFLNLTWGNLLIAVSISDLVKCSFIQRHITRWINTFPTSFDARQEKTDLKVFVVVIPKEGWARVAAPTLLLVFYNDKDLKVCFLVTHLRWQEKNYKDEACHS